MHSMYTHTHTHRHRDRHRHGHRDSRGRSRRREGETAARRRVTAERERERDCVERDVASERQKQEPEEGGQCAAHRELRKGREERRRRRKATERTAETKTEGEEHRLCRHMCRGAAGCTHRARLTCSYGQGQRRRAGTGMPKGKGAMGGRLGLVCVFSTRALRLEQSAAARASTENRTTFCAAASGQCPPVTAGARRRVPSRARPESRRHGAPASAPASAPSPPHFRPRWSPPLLQLTAPFCHASLLDHNELQVPSQCKLEFDDPDNLMEFRMILTPNEVRPPGARRWGRGKEGRDSGQCERAGAAKRKRGMGRTVISEGENDAAASCSFPCGTCLHRASTRTAALSSPSKSPRTTHTSLRRSTATPR